MAKFSIFSDTPAPARFAGLASRALNSCKYLLSQLGFAEVAAASATSTKPSLLGAYDASATVSAYSTIYAALASCRGVFLWLAVLSGMINILMLTGSFFMLQVYDRVLPSQSVPTLVGLSILAIALYILQGVLELIRSRVNVRIGAHLDQRSQLARLRRACPPPTKGTRRRRRPAAIA